MGQSNQFLEYVRQQCDKHGVNFVTKKTKRIRYQGYISGYFEGGDKPELGVALGNPQWRWILVHEYAHMTQWVDKCDAWAKSVVSSGKDAWDIMESHLQGQKISQEDLDEAYRIIIRCERDCDKRAVKLIKRFELPIEIPKYIRQSNAYHYFYHGVKATGKWYGKVPIYRNPKVVSLCPDTFRCQPEKRCPPDIFEAVLEHIRGNHGISY